jgi:hypothetical protein
MLAMFSLPLAMVFGIIGIFKDRPRWLAIVVTAVAVLLLSPSSYR